MAELKLTKVEAELLIRRLWGDCAAIGKTCHKGCGNLDKPCIKIGAQVDRKLVKLLGWDR